jgi:OmcA/MtrC family decaheme c-type cytochrome
MAYGWRVRRVAAIAMLVLMIGVVRQSAIAQQCVGDCAGAGSVTVADLIMLVNVALGSALPSACSRGIPAGGQVNVALVTQAVDNALNGCTEVASTGGGLSSFITDVAIASNGGIVTTFLLTDGNGMPLTPVLSAAQNDQQAQVHFTVAHVENYSGGGELGSPFARYVNDVNLTRPGYDNGGTLEVVDPVNGLYRYTFATQLPAGYDPSRTYTVGLQVDRTLNGQLLGVDPIFDVVPAGGTPEIVHDTTTEQCNHCHDPLIAHGNRREERLCMLCHTEAAVDAPPPPEQPHSIDIKSMIHKIHRGKDLPSIVNGPPGATYAIFSSFLQQDVVFAQKDTDGVVSGIRFPRNIEDCEACHDKGPTAVFHKERPAAVSCTSCHDDVNPSLAPTAAGLPGTNHFQAKGYADGDCAFCHVAEAVNEFDISVEGAHTIPERSEQLAGLNLEIIGITNTAPGQIPTIRFQVTDNSGAALTDLSGLDRLAFAIAGPTTDYATVLTPTAVGGGASGPLVGPDDAGVFQYTPVTAIPASATGTWSVGAEARRVVQLATVDPIPPKTVEEAAPNPVVTFTVDGSMPVARRTVVEDANCSACHGEFSKDFSVHGNLRNQTQYCVLCHNPNGSDVARRQKDSVAVAAGSPVTSIDFKVMIHKIHTGENLEQKPYLIYGFGLPPPAGTGYTINDFSDLRFPGDQRDCVKCHAADTYLLPPFPGTALGTQVAHLDPAVGDLVIDGQLGPIRAVCTSCHDAEDAVAHAETQTAPTGTEACTVCHEEGRDFAVSHVHAARN